MADWNLPPLSALGFTPYQPPPSMPDIPPEMLLQLLGNRPPPPAALGFAPPGQLPPTLGLPPPARNETERAVEGPMGIDYSVPGRGPAGPPAADVPTARSGYNPIADALAAYGHRGDTIWNNLALWAAPGVNRVEAAGRGVRNLAGEMTGVPAAGRAGQALAEGDIVRGAGEGLMALPSRVGSIFGGLLSSAEAQAPDPRTARIGEIDTDIRTREGRIQSYATRTFRGRTPQERQAARDAAIKVEQDAIGRLNTERTRLSTALEGEAERRRLQAEADTRGAAWRNTPTNQAYPGAIYGTTALGAVLGGYLPFRSARRPFREFNERTANLETRWRSALDRANDMSLSLTARRQAASEALGLRAQHQAATAAAPGHLTLRDRGRAAVTGGLLLDAGLTTPDFLDYVYSFGDPEGPLHSSSGTAANPLTNPTRAGTGFAFGAALGGLGEEIGSRFPGRRATLSYDAETDALLKRYPSLGPRGRRRR